MRFDLKVPFAEKDDAKKLGARWDPTSKVWYVVNKDDMTPFSKWSPVARDASASPPVAPARSAAPAKAQSDGKVYVGSKFVEQARVCECLPWEDCEKCRGMGL